MTTLEQELLETSLDDAVSIPWIVRLLENPQSKFSLPGKISLYDHDCLHKILQKDYSPSDEAFIVGFTMGSDPDTRWIHLLIFNIFSRYIYPKKYKFTSTDFIDFKAGFKYGKYINSKHSNSWDFLKMRHYEVEDIQQALSIKVCELRSLAHYISQQKKYKFSEQKKIANRLQRSSIICLAVGGCLIALNREFSGYGFIVTAISSIQLFGSACILRDRNLIEYACTVFIFVDLVGIYFWLLA